MRTEILAGLEQAALMLEAARAALVQSFGPAGPAYAAAALGALLVLLVLLALPAVVRRGRDPLDRFSFSDARLESELVRLRTDPDPGTLHGLAPLIEPSDKAELGATRRELRAAGYKDPSAVRVFYLGRAGLGIALDDAELVDLLLTTGDPKEAVAYFRNALAQAPDRADFRRGLALSLARAKRYPEAARVYAELAARGQAEPADRLEHAMAAARFDRWDDVRTIVAGLPPGMTTARRYGIDAMLADHEQDWAAADAAYAQAESLAANPAAVLNNWGVSQMSRGALAAATEMFGRALAYDSRLFSAKNNLVIARGLMGDYQLPAVPMTETEKGYLLNNLGVIARRNGQPELARGLFAAAVETHPQHYAAAASRLAALEPARA